MEELNIPTSIASSWRDLLVVHRAIAVIRVPEQELALAIAQALAIGGIRIIEITWSCDRPGKIISQLRSELSHCTIGCGTILNLDQLQEAIASGAQFIFSPHVDRQLITTAVDKYNLPIIPGALTPTEIVTAWQAGASCVKVFPIEAVGGASYIKNLQAPLGHIPLIPTGGVTIENARQMLVAGAIAVGLSSQLVPSTLVATRNWQAIVDRVETLLQSIKNQKDFS